MAGGIDWFRWHHGSVTDPKFQLIAKRSGVSLPDVLAVWAYLLEQASANETRGDHGDIDCEAVDCMFGFDDGQTKTILNAMQAREMLSDGRVTSWDKRQPKRERDTDNSAERTRAYRDRQKQQGDAQQNYVTPCDATEHQKNARGEKSREDISPSLRSGESAETAPPAEPEKPKGRKAQTLSAYLAECKRSKEKPVPDDHHIRRWAADAGVSAEMLQIAWVKFRERYTDGEKGKGKRYKDWPGHFATSVKDNWFKLWFADDDGIKWTTNGLTCKTVLDAQMKQQEAVHAA